MSRKSSTTAATPIPMPTLAPVLNPDEEDASDEDVPCADDPVCDEEPVAVAPEVALVDVAIKGASPDCLGKCQ